jgi:hypothetical protein
VRSFSREFAHRTRIKTFANAQNAKPTQAEQLGRATLIKNHQRNGGSLLVLHYGLAEKAVTRLFAIKCPRRLVCERGFIDLSFSATDGSS